MNEKVFLLNEYLRSDDKKYYVSDSNWERATVIMFELCPTRYDLDNHLASSALKTRHGLDLFDDSARYSDAVGVAYISNVPLYGTDKDTFAFNPEFEGLRLEPRPTNDYLKERFRDKMTAIATNPNVRLISYKLEIFERYFKDFMDNADSDSVPLIKQRLDSGDLKLLPFPAYRIEQIRRFENEYNQFKSCIDKLI